MQEEIAEMHLKHERQLELNVIKQPPKRTSDQNSLRELGVDCKKWSVISFIAGNGCETAAESPQQVDSPEAEDGKATSCITMFVIIHVLSIMDAWISRLPFIWYAPA